MTPRALIVDNSTEPEVYRPCEHWGPLLAMPWDGCRAPEHRLPADPTPYSHLILSGSPASILDQTDWMVAEQELVRRAVAAGKVVLGSCFGHQLIARALFGPSSVRRMPEPGIGWACIEAACDDPLVGTRGRTWWSFTYHNDEVGRLPEDAAERVATGSTGGIEAFRLRGHPVWGIQPHPEIGIVEGLRIIGSKPDPHCPARERFLPPGPHQARDSGWIVPLMHAFQQQRPLE